MASKPTRSRRANKEAQPSKREGPRIVVGFQLRGERYLPGDELPELNAKELARLRFLGRVK